MKKNSAKGDRPPPTSSASSTTKHRGKSIGGAIAKRGAELTDFAEKHSPTITSAIRTILGF
ncbi:MAG: hypothetical protein HC899_16335 [Leptolyngbyaceae cyanobacterium SM1_4_3]|nr:hypothetical protein [Leptolyngbyaceae cyanobacterium SM1_4_3]